MRIDWLSSSSNDPEDDRKFEQRRDVHSTGWALSEGETERKSDSGELKR